MFQKKIFIIYFFFKSLCVPLKFGSGTRIKIIEALCLGAIIISSKKGIEGIDLNSINPPFIVDNKFKYISKIFEILKNNKKLKRNLSVKKNIT